MTQPIPDRCFICGSDNPAGLRARFTAQEDGSFLARLVGREQHQGYPDRMHGGILAGVLAETIGRAAGQGVTPGDGTICELRVRYRRPVPLGVELAAEGHGRDQAAAALRLPDGELAVEAHLNLASATRDEDSGSRPGPAPSAPTTILKKQPNSRMCFVCGVANCAGLKVRFYERADNSVLARFTPTDQHVDHAGHLNIAAIAAVMDEAMGRAIMIPYGEAIWGVTAELRFRFLRPAPVGEELIAVGRIVSEKTRLFEGSGELWLPDGAVAVEGYGRYVKLDMVTLGGFDPVREEWRVRPD